MKLFLSEKQMNDLKNMIEDMLKYSKENEHTTEEFIIKLNKVKFELDKPNDTPLDGHLPRMKTLREINQQPNPNPFKQ